MDNLSDEKTPASPLIQLTTPGERLKYVRTMLRLTRSYLCENYALSPDSLRAWENGKLKLSPKALERCIKIYSKEGAFISKHWILTGEGLTPKLSLSIDKYFEGVDSSTQNESELLNDEELILREIAFFKSTSPNATVMLVTSDDMLPFYQKGDYVGGRFDSSGSWENYIGKDCIIETSEGERYFKRLESMDEEGNCCLVSLNFKEKLEPLVCHKKNFKLAIIVWMRRRVF